MRTWLTFQQVLVFGLLRCPSKALPASVLIRAGADKAHGWSPTRFQTRKFTVTGADPPLRRRPSPRPLIEPGREQPATCIKRRSWQELLGADNNTKWIFSNRGKQLSPLFECFTFPRSINWLFDHRQRCAVTDKEQVISKVAWRTERQPAVTACWRWDKGMVM